LKTNGARAVVAQPAHLLHRAVRASQTDAARSAEDAEETAEGAVPVRLFQCEVSMKRARRKRRGTTYLESLSVRDVPVLGVFKMGNERGVFDASRTKHLAWFVPLAGLLEGRRDNDVAIAGADDDL
jgi:hypothetical protein